MTETSLEDRVGALENRMVNVEACANHSKEHREVMREDVKYVKSRMGWLIGLLFTIVLGGVPSLAILAYQVTVELPDLKKQVEINQRTLWRKIEGETDRIRGEPSNIPAEELNQQPD